MVKTRIWDQRELGRIGVSLVNLPQDGSSPAVFLLKSFQAEFTYLPVRVRFGTHAHLQPGEGREPLMTAPHTKEN